MVHIGPTSPVLECCGAYPEHRADCWALDPARLPWHRPLLTRRCAARVERRGTVGHWGRCDLARHPEFVDHALERGLHTPRWSTRWAS